MTFIPRWQYLSWARDRFGAAHALRTYPAALLGRSIRVPAAGDTVRLRLGTADFSVYDEVFRHHEYAVEVGDPRFIVDAGAHIGLTSVYLARRYPLARIIAIELDPGNFAMLRVNVAPFPNVTPIHAGLWGHETTLKVSNPSDHTWSFRAKEGGSICALTIPQILKTYGADRVDLLKIDIEGGEKGVLEESSEWMGKVGSLVIELHDRHVPGCSEALATAIAGQGFARSESGGSVVLRRL